MIAERSFGLIFFFGKPNGKASEEAVIEIVSNAHLSYLDKPHWHCSPDSPAHDLNAGLYVHIEYILASKAKST